MMRARHIESLGDIKVRTKFCLENFDRDNFRYRYLAIDGKIIMKYKAVPLPPCRRQGREKYSSYSFITLSLNSGEWWAVSVMRPARLTPGKGPRNTLDRRLVWTQRLEEKYFASAGVRTSVVQSVVRHYSDWANPTPNNEMYLRELNL
jgi:hypothetical protein